jgi:hypothetical protein
MTNEVLVKVLELFYDSWFMDYVVGFSNNNKQGWACMDLKEKVCGMDD